MSWETMYDRLEISHCLCGKGTVTRQTYFEMDDFNRARDGYYDEKIQCTDCATKYHIEHHIRYYFCPPWKGDGIADTPYLVPNNMTLKHDVNEKIFVFSLKERIISSYKKDSLESVIDDMEKSRYSTRVELTDSKEIVNLYYRKHNKRSLPNIIELLKQCVSDYSSYEWDFDRMQEYRQQEQNRIEANIEKINNTIAHSYELKFKTE